MLLVPSSYRITCPICSRRFHPREALYRDINEPKSERVVELEEELGLTARIKNGLAKPIFESPVIGRKDLKTSRWTRFLLGTKNFTPTLKGDSIRLYHRVCPYCRATIPQQVGNDGTASLIAVVGFSSSGKSCLIGELISELTNYASTANFSFMPMTTYDVENQTEIGSEQLFVRRYGAFDPSARKIEEYRLSDGRQFRGVVLPEATDPSDGGSPDYRIPLIYRVLKDGRAVDLYLFDKAGEELNDIEQYRSYLESASAIAFVVDPLQDAELSKLTPFANPSVSGFNPIERAYEIMKPGRKNKGWKIEVPTAIATSKSDLFDQQLGTQLEADATLSHAEPSEPRRIKHINGYNVKACDDVSRKIHALLKRRGSKLANAADILANPKYFAFSVFGKSPDSGLSVGQGTARQYYRLEDSEDESKPQIWESRHVLDPFLWMFYELGVLPSETGKRKKTFPEKMQRKFWNSVRTNCSLLLFFTVALIVALIFYRVVVVESANDKALPVAAKGDYDEALRILGGVPDDAKESDDSRNQNEVDGSDAAGSDAAQGADVSQVLMNRAICSNENVDASGAFASPRQYAATFDASGFFKKVLPIDRLNRAKDRREILKKDLETLKKFAQRYEEAVASRRDGANLDNLANARRKMEQIDAALIQDQELRDKCFDLGLKYDAERAAISALESLERGDLDAAEKSVATIAEYLKKSTQPSDVRVDYEAICAKAEKLRAASNAMEDALSSFREGSYELLEPSSDKVADALTAMQVAEETEPKARVSENACSKDRYCVGMKFCFLGLQASIESQAYCQKAIYLTNYDAEYANAEAKLNDAREAFENAEHIYEELKRRQKENERFPCFLDADWKGDVESLRENIDAYRAYYGKLVQTKQVEANERFDEAKICLDDARVLLQELQGREFPDFGRSNKSIENLRNNNVKFFKVQSEFLKAKKLKLNSHKSLLGDDFNAVMESAPEELNKAIRVLADVKIPAFIDDSQSERAQLIGENGEYLAFRTALDDAFVKAPELYKQVQENVATGDYATCDDALTKALSYWNALKTYAPGVDATQWFGAISKKFSKTQELVAKLQESREESLASFEFFQNGALEDALRRWSKSEEAFNEANTLKAEIDEELKSSGLSESSLQLNEGFLVKAQGQALEAFGRWLNQEDYAGGKKILETATSTLENFPTETLKEVAGFYRQTIDDLDVIANSPEEAEAKYRLAVESYESMRFKDALSFLNDALTIVSNNKKYLELKKKSEETKSVEERVESAREDRRNESWSQAAEKLREAQDDLNDVARFNFFVKLEINDAYARAESAFVGALESALKTFDYQTTLEELKKVYESLNASSSERDAELARDLDATIQEIKSLKNAVEKYWNEAQKERALNESVESFDAAHYALAFENSSLFKEKLNGFLSESEGAFAYVRKLAESWRDGSEIVEFDQELEKAREKTRERRDALARSIKTLENVVAAPKGAKVSLKLVGLLDDDGANLTFVWNPAGDYYSGLPISVDPARSTKKLNEDSETEPKTRIPSRRLVSLTKGFWMLDSETTREAFAQIMNADRPIAEEASKPAIASWSESAAFCDALGAAINERLDKLSEDKSNLLTLQGAFSLPTVAEWDYAAKLDGAEPYLSRARMSEIATYDQASVGAVKQKSSLSLDLELYDMFGNVAEWVDDGESNERFASRLVDPRGEASSPELKTCCGGSYADKLSLASAYYRLETRDARYENVGFRFIYKPNQAPRRIENDVYVDALGKTYVGSRGENVSFVTYPAEKESNIRLASNYDELLERVARRVELKGKYYMASCPVTVGDFEKFVEATGYVSLAEQGYPVLTPSGAKIKGGNWRNPGFDQSKDEEGKNLPVVCVSFFDALRYVEWLNENYPLDGELKNCVYQLPSEDVWEYFARGDSIEPRVPWGKFDWAFDYVKCLETPSTSPSKTPSPVASFYPNKLGVFDAIGNVCQWTTSLAAPNTPDQRTRVIRGGSWASKLEDCDLLSRASLFPALSYADVGFRVCIGSPTQIKGDLNVPSLDELPVGQIALSATETSRAAVSSVGRKRLGDCLRKD